MHLVQQQRCVNFINILDFREMLFSANLRINFSCSDKKITKLKLEKLVCNLVRKN